MALNNLIRKLEPLIYSMEDKEIISKYLELKSNLTYENLIYFHNFLKQRYEILNNILKTLEVYLNSLDNKVEKFLEQKLDKLEKCFEVLHKTILKNLSELIDFIDTKSILFKREKILLNLKLELEHLKPFIIQKYNEIFLEEEIEKFLKNLESIISKEIKENILKEFKEGRKKFFEKFENIPLSIYDFFRSKLENVKILFILNLLIFSLNLSLYLLYKTENTLLLLLLLLQFFIFFFFVLSILLFKFFMKRNIENYVRKKLIRLKSEIADFYLKFFENLKIIIKEYLNNKKENLDREKKKLQIVLETIENFLKSEKLK